MLWLVDLAGQAIWQSTEGGLRFAAALGVVTLHVVLLILWLQKKSATRRERRATP